MLENDLIRDDSLKPMIKDGENIGISFESRLPFYRALPLSCIVGVNLLINDELIDPEHITFILRGTEYKISDLPPLMETWWGFTEDATFIVKNTGAPWRGYVELDLTLRTRLPYLIPSGGEWRPNYDNTRVMKSFKI